MGQVVNLNRILGLLPCDHYLGTEDSLTTWPDGAFFYQLEPVAGILPVSFLRTGEVEGAVGA